MKEYLHSLTLVCAVVLMCAGCATAPVQRTAWEYKYINSCARSPRVEELDALGKAGARSGRSMAELVRDAIRKVVLKSQASGPVAIWDGEPKRASMEHDSVHDEP